MDLIPYNLSLSALENSLTYAMSREYTLRNCLSSIKDDYDYILLDCQPSLGMLAINALAIANATFKILNTDTNQYVSQYVGGKVYSEQEKI
ncbi:sporulation initiation inhibitor protein Soj [Clostridium sp. CAG:921]|nr:sporulation initiation inhibitor protein Soj [Clostridium sp. CAG:921]